MANWIGERINVVTGGILHPPFKGYKKNIGCLYKMNFGKKKFYYGSTRCILTRISSHKSSHDLKFQWVRRGIKWEDLRSIEIIEVSDNIGVLRDKEWDLISKSFLDPNCINVSRGFCRNPGRPKKILNIDNQ